MHRRRVMIGPLTAGLVSVMAIVPATQAQDRVATGVHALLKSINARADREATVHCAGWGYTPLDSGRLISVCIGRVADTLFVIYRQKDGAPIAAKQQVFVPRPKLRLLTDSLRLSLREQLGPDFTCTESPEDMLRPAYLWSGKRYSVLLVTADLASAPGSHQRKEYTWVGMQVAIADPPRLCGDWLPGRN